MASTTTKDEASANHDERIPPSQAETEDWAQIGCETDAASLPKGYYYSRFFLGSLMATGLGLWAAVASFVSLAFVSSG